MNILKARHQTSVLYLSFILYFLFLLLIMSQIGTKYVGIAFVFLWIMSIVTRNIPLCIFGSVVLTLTWKWMLVEESFVTITHGHEGVGETTVKHTHDVKKAAQEEKNKKKLELPTLLSLPNALETAKKDCLALATHYETKIVDLRDDHIEKMKLTKELHKREISQKNAVIDGYKNDMSLNRKRIAALEDERDNCRREFSNSKQVLSQAHKMSKT